MPTHNLRLHPHERQQQPQKAEANCSLSQPREARKHHAMQPTSTNSAILRMTHHAWNEDAAGFLQYGIKKMFQNTINLEPYLRWNHSVRHESSPNIMTGNKGSQMCTRDSQCSTAFRFNFEQKTFKCVCYQLGNLTCQVPFAAMRFDATLSSDSCFPYGPSFRPSGLLNSLALLPAHFKFGCCFLALALQPHFCSSSARQHVL